MSQKRQVPHVDTSALFLWLGPEAGAIPVLSPEDLWGEGLESPRLRVALEVVKRLLSVAAQDPAFTRDHLEVLEGTKEILEDLLRDTPPPQWWEREWGLEE